MKKSVFKATATVFSLTLIAKIIAFAKSILQASYFGASLETDAFNLSSGFVNNVLYMFTTALAVAFVPLYIQHKTNGEEEGRRFASKSITVLFLTSLALTALLICAAPWIVKLIAPRYKDEALSITIRYFRVLCLGIAFSLIASLYSNLLNAEKRYGYPAATSILNSITLILMIVLFSGKLGVWALVISLPLSYLVQCLFLYGKGSVYAKLSLKYGLRDESIKLLLLQATPILLSQATVEINQVVDKALLSSVGTGVITAVSYSAVLYQFASALVIAPLSTVVFTELSEAAACTDHNRIGELLNTCYKTLLLVCIPILVLVLFCSYSIVSIIYGHGAFEQEAIRQCAQGLAVYVFCLLPACIKTVLSRAYYSLNDTRRPMVFGMLEVALNIGLSILLVKPFGIMGVVGATALASLVFVIVMLCDFNRKYFRVVERRQIAACWKQLLCGILMILLLFLMSKLSFPTHFVSFVIKAIVSFSFYFGLLILLKDSTVLYASNVLITTINRKTSK